MTALAPNKDVCNMGLRSIRAKGAVARLQGTAAADAAALVSGA